MGLDESGRILFYAMGEETEPADLAAGLQAVGARQAAQLDINWSWTKFLLLGDKGGERQVTSTLIPKMVHARKGYVEKTAFRDFFYFVPRP